MRPRPTFVGVGARKAGTTWLAECLREHPQVFMSTPKELSYFGRHYGEAHDEDWYLGHFSEAGGYRAVGEYSPSYLRHPEAARRMAADLGEVRIIVALRDPVARFLSDYKQAIRDGKFDFDEPNRFDSQKLDRVMRERPKILQSGLYHAGLARFYDCFPASAIHVILKQDIDREPDAVLARLYEFIGVDADFRPALTGKNISVGIVPRYRRLESLRIAIHKRARRRFPWLINLVKKSGAADGYRTLNRSREAFEVDTRCREALREYYRRDIEQTARLIDRDLSAWFGDG